MVLAKCETRKLEYGFTWSHDELRFEPAKVLKIPQRSAYCAAILYYLDRGVKGGEHAAGVSAAKAGEVPGGSVVGRGPHQVQSCRAVDAVVKGKHFKRNQALVVVERQGGVDVAVAPRGKKSVGGKGSVHVQTFVDCGV